MMQNVPTQSDECVCVYIFPVILFKSILTIAFCSTLSSFFFHHSSSKFARFLFLLFKSLHVLTHSLTLVNRFGGGGTGGRTGVWRGVRWRWGWENGGVYPRDLYCEDAVIRQKVAGEGTGKLQYWEERIRCGEKNKASTASLGPSIDDNLAPLFRSFCDV